MEFVWIKRNRTEQSYGKIKPGETHTRDTYVGHVWLLKSVGGKRHGCFAARPDDLVVIDPDSLKDVRIDRPIRARSRRNRAESNAAKSQPPRWKARIREHNLWVKAAGENESDDIHLTTDATEDNSFEFSGDSQRGGRNIRISPDSKYIVAFQTKKTDEPVVHYIESSPSDQLQPKLQQYRYPKPGDELPVQKLRLIAIGDQKEIEVSDALFNNPFSLRFLSWSESSDRFWLEYNQRGHQVFRLLEVTAADGKVRTVIEETSDTFIHYSDPGKSVREDLPGDEILWSSERTGWNHLYRYDRKTGEVLNAVTSGEWNVIAIQHLDTENQVVWFYAVGVYPDQDPYHQHYCRVNLDGSNFKILTDGDGTHWAKFEQDKKYIVDTWSRVDLAPVTEMRDAETGELVAELDRQDTQETFGDRKLSTRFTAKGRDGETDIWGIIHWPRDFDPNASYPVVENIYAGPHGQHVPKRFRVRYGHQHQIADAGMIVVQIDGMGTAWRSKSFQDVCYKNLKDAGFPDRIAWIKAAAKQFPQMDITRVGIYGGSAGGQNAMAALLWHNDFYDVAVADCGCHDNRMDKIWWNEQWMGWPIEQHYIENSNMENAGLLKGKLMLTLGELDRNVDPASTTQVVKKLIEHDKDFEFVLVAGQGHGAGETPWAAKKRLKFLKENLSVK